MAATAPPPRTATAIRIMTRIRVELFFFGASAIGEAGAGSVEAGASGTEGEGAEVVGGTGAGSIDGLGVVGS